MGGSPSSIPHRSVLWRRGSVEALLRSNTHCQLRTDIHVRAPTIRWLKPALKEVRFTILSLRGSALLLVIDRQVQKGQTLRFYPPR